MTQKSESLFFIGLGVQKVHILINLQYVCGGVIWTIMMEQP